MKWFDFLQKAKRLIVLFRRSHFASFPIPIYLVFYWSNTSRKCKKPHQRVSLKKMKWKNRSKTYQKFSGIALLSKFFFFNFRLAPRKLKRKNSSRNIQRWQLRKTHSFYNEKSSKGYWIVAKKKIFIKEVFSFKAKVLRFWWL